MFSLEKILAGIFCSFLNKLDDAFLCDIENKTLDSVLRPKGIALGLLKGSGNQSKHTKIASVVSDTIKILKEFISPYNKDYVKSSILILQYLLILLEKNGRGL